MPEIEVLGGGIFGLSVAFACQRRGARVRVLEKRWIGSGASGGLLGALAPHVPDNWNEKKEFQFQSLIASRDFWPEVDRIGGGCSGFGVTGRLVPIPDEHALALARQRQGAARRHWGEAAQWEVVPAGRFEGWEPPSPTGFLVHDTLSARIMPRTACRSLAQAFVALGGEIVLGDEAPRGADALVLATGHEGLDALSREWDRPLGKGVKGQALTLALDARGWPQLFADGIHFVPHADGTLAIGSTSETDWAGADTTDDRLEDLLARALGVMPVLADARVLHRWGGVRPRGRRRSPILGRHPLRQGVYIANGGFKIGFGVAVRAGEAMADLILSGRDDIPASFAPEANLG